MITLKYKILILLVIAFIPRIVGIDKHSLFADEITWMVRSKGVYAAVHSQIFKYFDTGWWLDTTTSEPIGLPMAFLGGAAMSYLSPGYSNYTLNITKDFVAVRVPAAILGSLFIPIFYLLLRKITKEKVAFLSSILLAFDPISIALSRWLHQDLSLMVFSTLSLLIFLNSSKKLAIMTSAFLASLAILTKPQGFLVPITISVFEIIQLIFFKKNNIKRLVLWLAMSLGFTVLLFPFLWKDPINGMLKYLEIQSINAIRGQLTFFNSQITSNPSWYYYFVILPFRLPESILIGLVTVIILSFPKIKKGLVKNKLFLLALIYSTLYVVIVSISAKKLGIRYLFGIWPYIYIAAVFGLFKISENFKHLNKIIFWGFVFIFPIWGIFKFYPSYYLFHNHFITPRAYQNLESVGFCDSVKPAIEYLEPNLFHGVKIMLMGCDSSAHYFTGNTIKASYGINEEPDFIIEENYDAQLNPDRVSQIENSGYKMIKEINFRGLLLGKIYQKP